MKTVFLVAGPAQHGKTTITTDISKTLDIARGSTSDMLFKLLAKELSTTEEELRARNKETIRPRLIALGKEVCASNKAQLILNLVDIGVRAIDGLRSKEELYLANKHLTGRGFDVITIWIENPNKPILSDVGDLTPEDLQNIIINDGTLEELHFKVLSIVHPFVPCQTVEI